MAELAPQPLEHLLRRITAERARTGAIFDLPERSFWKGSRLDLSTRIHGRRVATALGPAAGPHTQLAQNIALAWLGGARAIELKTVQIDDRLAIPRPCIDARNVVYNVEWSQELALDQSLEEYAKAWLLVHILGRMDPCGLRPEEKDTVFDASLGYSLAGIRSERMARWLDRLRDGSAIIARQKQELPRELRPLADVDVPSEISASVTLSTFHGCPPDEIEAIVTHLLERHAVDVVVKLNPTLLGREAVEAILVDRLGYKDLRLHGPAFEADLAFHEALSMFARLEAVAARAGRAIGAKFTNTLVVENRAGFVARETALAYLSGAPLHPIAIELARRFCEATAGRIPISFSGGIDRANFAAVAGAGLAPVTTCSDLLRPPGYGRLPGYLAELERAIESAGARSLEELVARRGGIVRALPEYAPRALSDPRYSFEKNRSEPRRTGGTLALFDCLSCDKCVRVCPNDANFAFETAPLAAAEPTLDLVVGDRGEVREEPGRDFALAERRQFAQHAESCNECGNCDVFCPEAGGPYLVKPRFFSSEAAYRAAPALDGFHAEPRRLLGRFGGKEHVLRLDGDDRALFGDGIVTAWLDARTHALLEATAHFGAPAGHRLELWRYRAMRALMAGVLAGINPVSAALPPATD